MCRVQRNSFLPIRRSHLRLGARIVTLNARYRIGLVGGARCDYAVALRNMGNFFQIAAVTSVCKVCASRLARFFGCSCAEGLVDVLESFGVQALVITEEAWFGAWPLELALRYNVPVFCTVPLDSQVCSAGLLATDPLVSQALLLFRTPWSTGPGVLAVAKRLRRSRLRPVVVWIEGSTANRHRPQEIQSAQPSSLDDIHRWHRRRSVDRTWNLADLVAGTGRLLGISRFDNPPTRVPWQWLSLADGGLHGTWSCVWRDACIRVSLFGHDDSGPGQLTQVPRLQWATVRLVGNSFHVDLSSPWRYSWRDEHTCVAQAFSRQRPTHYQELRQFYELVRAWHSGRILRAPPATGWLLRACRWLSDNG